MNAVSLSQELLVDLLNAKTQLQASQIRTRAQLAQLPSIADLPQRLLYGKGCDSRLENQTEVRHRLGKLGPSRGSRVCESLVRDEIAIGRLVIPANIRHVAGALEPMCIGKVAKVKINPNIGNSAVSSDINGEIEVNLGFLAPNSPAVSA